MSHATETPITCSDERPCINCYTDNGPCLALPKGVMETPTCEICNWPKGPCAGTGSNTDAPDCSLIASLQRRLSAETARADAAEQAAQAVREAAARVCDTWPLSVQNMAYMQSWNGDKANAVAGSLYAVATLIRALPLPDAGAKSSPTLAAGWKSLLEVMRPEGEPTVSVSAKWIARMGDKWLPDHACKECAPYSEILIDGFQCYYHRALSVLKALHRPAQSGEGQRHG